MGDRLTAVVPPRGHRHHQLRVAMDLLAVHGRPRRLVDVGTGDGWVPDGWREGPAVGLDRYRATTWRGGDRVVGDTAALPLRDGVASTCTAIAALGAFGPSQLVSVVGELARILEHRGVLIVLVSHQSPLYDRVAVHRVLSRFRWSSHTTGSLEAAVAANGMEVVHVERRGGLATLVAEWLHFLTQPAQRWAVGRRLVERVGELDARSMRFARPNGRYLYLVARRS